jgi:hypothetical protein
MALITSYPFFLKLRTSFVLVVIHCCLAIALSQNVAPVSFSKVGGKFNTPIEVSLNCTTPNAVIRYTTDGSVPTENSFKYTAPLSISNNTALRAVAFSNGLLPSNILTNSYLFNINHTFPVVSLVFQEGDFFDPITGIYPNYLLDLTTQANIEFFETNATKAAFNQLIEAEVQGTASAGNAQKSLIIKSKTALGVSTIDFKVFPDLPYTKYKQLVLRNAGQDWNVLMFRDEFVTSLATDIQDLEGILSKPDLDLQSFRPSVMYFNGQYWGIHNIRERMNRHYVMQHHDLDSGSFDMLENYAEVLSGDSIEWFLFNDFLLSNNFQSELMFNKIKEKIDYQNFIDYCAYNIYIDNQDWPGNNVRRFRERKADGKWRWVCFDFDYSFGLYQAGVWNTGDASADAMSRILNPLRTTWPNPDWATLLFRSCWQNAGFRRDFANRMADFMNTIFMPNRVNARLEGFKNLYQPEIAQHFNRWTSGYYEPFWLENIEKTRRFSNERPHYLRSYLKTALPEITGTQDLTLDALPAEGGKIEISTITLDVAQFPWKGSYFSGIKIPVKAIANPGYVFSGWSDPNLGNADAVAVTLSSAKKLTAKFIAIRIDNDTMSNNNPLQTGDTTKLKPILSDFSIFPNPTNDKVSIDVKAWKDAAVEVQLYNIEGVLLQNWQISKVVDDVYELSLSKMDSGLYFLEIKKENGRPLIKKLVVIKTD